MIQTRAAHDVAERAARESYGKLLAYLAKRCGGVGAAEDALADAFASALERWPIDGVPRVPEAWLLVAARHRFVDAARREQRSGRMHDRLVNAARDAQARFESGGDVGDDRVDVMFACAHPAIARSVRAPLMLQVVLGLDAARIASAFLVAPAAMSQRLVRAKQKIAATGIPLAVPDANALPERLDAVLDAIYTAFAEGWDDASGADQRTRGLSAEAMWLGATLARLVPKEPEVAGLRALMLYADARRSARRDTDGRYVPLDEQDTSRWNREAIVHAEQLMEAAIEQKRIGRFQLEAAIQSAHVVRRLHGVPNWDAILALYDELLRLTASPVVALNRAVAVSRVHGARKALEVLDELAVDPRLEGYQPYWATRAHVLAELGAIAAARAAYARTLGLTIDPCVREYLMHRAANLEHPGREAQGPLAGRGDV